MELPGVEVAEAGFKPLNMRLIKPFPTLKASSHSGLAAVGVANRVGRSAAARTALHHALLRGMPAVVHLRRLMFVMPSQEAASPDADLMDRTWKTLWKAQRRLEEPRIA